MNMWAEGRAYGYIYFKKTMPTENRGGGALLPAQDMDPALCADVVITITNRNSSKQNAVIFRWSSVLAPAVAVRPVVGRMLCGSEPMRLLEHIAGSDSSSLPL